jgi:hypothetical protein
MAVYWVDVMDLRICRMRAHLLRNGWGHKNSKRSRRARQLIAGMGYGKHCDKYLRGAHRLIREAVAEFRRMAPTPPAGKGE